MEYAVVLLPLIGCITGYFSKYFGDIFPLIITTLFIFISSILSILIFYNGIAYDSYGNYLIYEWISSGNFVATWSINIDPLSSIMLVVVSLISFLVHFYSIGYMRHDPNKARFMSYLSLFTFSMLILVVSDNFLQLFFGWEGVGLSSYLLIGFWYKRDSANKAAIKAFLVNRVGDFGFAIGIFLIFIFFGSINYNEVFQTVPDLSLKQINFLGMNINLITLICLFLFMGAMGKSAQFFLHTWLPDAMEGPTPVSALIHAATMVTAGVFLVVRCSPIFEYSEFALNFVAIIGMLTAIFAASVALVQNDIKRIIAYSTCSQLGYMFFAAGVGAYHVAIFHLFTHAFFKALLFLGSGSVIHSLNDEQDIRNMGGLWKAMPFTWISMLIGTLALTGFPFLSGYYSKDAIIEFAYLSGTNVGYSAAAIGIFTAILTALYSWRLIFKTFHGKFNNQKLSKSEVHESEMVIIIPLAILVLGSILAGLLFKDFLIGKNFLDFWKNSIFFLNEIDHSHVPFWLLITTPALVSLSIPVAYYFYIRNKRIFENIKFKNEKIYNFLLNKWYFDEFYERLLVKPLKKLGLYFWKSGDEKTINHYGPDGISKIIKKISEKAVKLQSGYIFDYAFVMLLGFSLLLTFFIIYK
mgnify:CR=1 FL=1|tara:strand:+ start:9249 stop:11159 length:1911 start_codon:yes stop_codon:yes gene_type:complete